MAMRGHDGFDLGPGCTQDNWLSKLFPAEHYKLAPPHPLSGAVISGQCGALTTLGGQHGLLHWLCGNAAAGVNNSGGGMHGELQGDAWQP